MSSCHSGPGDLPEARAGSGTVTARREPRVALLGNPNVGKSTMFNALTGSRQRVMNAPGTTVELTTGTWRTPAGPVRLVDLPGTYSLLARSEDERVAAEAAMGEGALPTPDAIVVVLEAAALPRALYLLGQLLAHHDGAASQAPHAGPAVVVALTMMDVARTRGITPDTERLARVLALPVVGVDPRAGSGMDDLANAVTMALADHADGRDQRAGLRPAPVAGLPADIPGDGPGAAARETARAESVFAWVEDVLARTGSGVAPAPRATLSDRVDRVLLNPWVGVPVFLAVMWALFQLATTVAAPVMGAVEDLFTWLGDGLAGGIDAVGGPGWISSFLVDGVLAGVGTVCSFLPLLAIVFGAIALLEDSGYLARAAFVADRAMGAIGLDGRAMLPLVIGFGCNVPALTATRTLPRARSRLLVGMLIPFTSCPARLTVYLLIASAVYPQAAGTAVFLLYVASIVLVVLGGLVLRHTVLRDVRREGLVLALPAYQVPRVGMLARTVGTRCMSFLRKAGVIIVATLSVVWLLMAVPTSGDHAVGDVPVAQSAYGSAARAIAPVLEPAGFGDWHFTAALATGFVAKEVVVGSFAQTYAMEEPDDPSDAGGLGERINATLEATSGGHAAAAASAFLVFTLAYTPCLATIAEQRRLFGWRWTLGGVAAQLTTAWVLAVIVFRVGSLLGTWFGGAA